MSELENRNTLERFFQAFAWHDLEAIDDLGHDDYVEEYPQSGERIRGKQTARTVTENYPGAPPIGSTTASSSTGTSVFSRCSPSMTATRYMSAR